MQWLVNNHPSGLVQLPSSQTVSPGILFKSSRPSRSLGLVPRSSHCPKDALDRHGTDLPVLAEVNGTTVTNLYSTKAVESASNGTGSAHIPADGQATQVQQPIPVRMREALKNWFLPAGYPYSTTPDYLDYQLISFPTHVTGWLSHSLITSSLLSAVGLSAGPAGTVATSAGIKWITKDGIGTLGRFFVGGRLAQEFDDDPRFWRMAGEALSTLGAGLEIATVAYPQHFLLLASAGNFTHALSKSLGRPVFRVIQTHFAATNNVGAVAAKEEVWEVSAELVGTVSSLALLTALASLPNDGSVDKAAITMATWGAIQSVHVTLRYLALKSLQFPSMNEKRVRLLVTQHVQGLPLSGVKEANKAEPIFELQPWVPFPKVHLGTESVQQCLWGGISVEIPSSSTPVPHARPSGMPHAGAAQAVDAGAAASSRITSSSSTSTSTSTSTSSASMSGVAVSKPASSSTDPNHSTNKQTSTSFAASGPSSIQQQQQQQQQPHSPLASTAPSFSPPSTPPPLSQVQHASSTASSSAQQAFLTAHPAAHNSMQHRSLADCLQEYLALYSQERHVLVWRGGEAHVLLHEDAEPQTLLQAMWQAAWLHHHHPEQQQQLLLQSDTRSVPSPAEEASVHALRQHFPSFLQQAGDLGYKLEYVSVHRGKVRIRVGEQQVQRQAQQQRQLV